MRSQSKYIPLRSEELPALPPAFISKWHLVQNMISFMLFMHLWLREVQNKNNQLLFAVSQKLSDKNNAPKIRPKFSK